MKTALLALTLIAYHASADTWRQQTSKAIDLHGDIQTMVFHGIEEHKLTVEQAKSILDEDAAIKLLMDATRAGFSEGTKQSMTQARNNMAIVKVQLGNLMSRTRALLLMP
jgi:hypothetical protein